MDVLAEVDGTPHHFTLPLLDGPPSRRIIRLRLTLRLTAVGTLPLPTTVVAHNVAPSTANIERPITHILPVLGGLEMLSLMSICAL